MKSMMTTEELQRRLSGIRSISGCMRLAHLIITRDIDASDSPEKVRLLIELLQKMRELGGIDPETDVLPADHDARQLLRHYAAILVLCTNIQTLSGNRFGDIERDAQLILHIADLLKDEDLKASGLNTLGNILIQQQKNSSGLKCFRQSIALSRKNNQHEALACTLYNLARTHVLIGELPEALQAVEEGLRIYEQHLSLPLYGLAFFLSIRQQMYRLTQEIEKALADALRMLELFRQTGLTARLVLTHTDIVECYLALDKPEGAMRHAIQAEHLASQTKSVLDRISADFNLSNIYIWLKEPDKAMHYARRVVEKSREEKLSRMEARGLVQIAHILQIHKKHRAALSYFYKSLEKEDSPTTRMILHEIIASTWCKLGAYEKARKEMKKREQISCNLKTTHDSAHYLLTCAELDAGENKTDQAIRLFNRITSDPTVRPTFRGKAHLALSNIYQATGNPQQALEHYRLYHALKIEREQNLAESRLVILRVRHEIENHSSETAKAQESGQSLAQEKEELALSLSEQQSIIEQTRQAVASTLRNLERCHLEEGKKELQKILRELRQTPVSTKERPHDQPHPESEFFIHLHQRYPNLTKGQSRLCGLLRSGYSSPEIARQLHISIQTVLTQRKRLRKRMSLRKEDSLEEIIAQI